MGRQAFAEIKRTRPISTNSRYRSQLKRVASRLAEAVAPNQKWEFVVFKDPEPNAFALPGGKVGVNSGLFPITKTDAGLAAIVGHEMAHVTARHASERVSHNLLTQLGAAAVNVALSQVGGVPYVSQGLVMRGYGLGSEYGVLLPFSRHHESEADRIGLIYMARAGYDPRAAIGVWERMEQRSRERGGTPFELLSTHPVDASRIRTIKKHLPEALKIYEGGETRSR